MRRSLLWLLAPVAAVRSGLGAVRPWLRGLGRVGEEARALAARPETEPRRLRRLQGRPRRVEKGARCDERGAAGGVRALAARGADGLPGECLQRLHGGADPDALAGPEVHQGPGHVAAEPVEEEVLRAARRERRLDWIEHEQLRPRYKDPRVHAAVNCASIGCPALRPEAFTAPKLDGAVRRRHAAFHGRPHAQPRGAVASSR